MKHKNKSARAFQFVASSLTTALMLMSITGTASAAILFQDDTFATIESDAIQIGSNDAGASNTAVKFGADVTASENGNIKWNISTNRFSVDHAVDVTGGLTSDGVVDIGGTNGLTGNSPAASRNMLRKDSAPNTNAACSALGEVIVNTTTNRLEVCTTTGAAGVAVWSAPTVTIPSGAINPATCSVSDLYYNTTTNTLNVCTATNTWTTAGPQDFEAVYSYDADKTLTTGGGNMTFATGGGNLNHNLGAGEFDVTSTGLIDFNATTFDVDTTGATTIDANGASNFTTTAGNLTLSTVTSGAVNVTGADNVNVTSGSGDDITMVSGDDITFDDAQLTAAIQLTDTATGIAATYGTNAIIDALNSLTSTASGSGASNVGVFDSGNYFTGTDVEAALQELGAASGANAPNNDVLTFSPEYPNYVIFRDTTNNNGTLVQDYDTTGANYTTATDPRQQYYGWTTNNASLSDIDVKFRFPLPADFVSVGNFTLRYLTGTATNTDNKVDVKVSNATDLTASAPTSCGTSTANTSTTWGTITITAATINGGCTGGTALNAGDLVEIDTTLYDITGGTTFARAGTASLAYSN